MVHPLDLPYCGFDPPITPIWRDSGFSPCFEATTGSFVGFCIIFLIGGSVALCGKPRSDVLLPPGWMRHFELICGVVAAMQLAKLVGTCAAERTVVEVWVVDGLLSAGAWTAAALQIRGRRARRERTVGRAIVAFWLWSALRAAAVVASWASPLWFWHAVGAGELGAKAVLAVLNFVVYTTATVVMLGWHYAATRTRTGGGSGHSLNVDDKDLEREPLLPTASETADQGKGKGKGKGDGKAAGKTAVEQRTGSTFSGFGSKVGMLWPYVWPRGHPGLQLRIVICIAALVGIRITNVMVPLSYKRIIDHLSTQASADNTVLGDGDGNGGPNEPTTISCPWTEIGVYVALRFCQGGGIGSMGLLSNLRSFLWIPVQQYTSRGMRVRLFRHFHEQDLKWHLSRKTGEVLRMMDRGSDSINNLLSYIIFNIAPTLIDIGIAIGFFTSKFGAYYGLIVFATMGTYIWFTVSVTEWRTKFRRTMNTKDNQIRQKATDSLLNAETVKLYLGERYERDDFEAKIVDYQAHEWRSLASLSLLNVGQSVVITVGLAGGTFLCGYEVSRGKLTIGDFVLFITYITQLYMPLNWFGTYFRMIQAAFVDMENMLDLFDIVPEVVDKPGALPLALPGAGDAPISIEFDNVHFGYSAERPILKGISFSVPAGKSCAIVGSTGSGKSTIMRMLFRFYDVDSGCIKIDGQKITEHTLDSVRGVMGVVPQDTVLFNDTIQYNIKYGQRDATDADIEVAAKGSEIHQAILGFPEQYKTIVGERGLKLSGGEKQRVAIARTILKKPLIVMLDEATSALDTQTERQIQATLGTLCSNRTTVVIAHRLSTVVNADEILVLNDGLIVERGVHAALLQRCGHYAEMWNAQAAVNQPADA